MTSSTEWRVRLEQENMKERPRGMSIESQNEIGGYGISNRQNVSASFPLLHTSKNIQRKKYRKNKYLMT